MFFEQLSQICNENNTTITTLLKKLGLSKSSQLNWKNGSYMFSVKYKGAIINKTVTVKNIR